MEPCPEAPARPPRRAVVTLLSLVGLLVLVAIGSAGHTPVDVGGRRPSYVVADTIVSLVLVVLVLGAFVAVWAVIAQRDHLAAQRLTRRRGRPIVVVGVALVLVALTLLARGVLHANGVQRPPRPQPPAASGTDPGTPAEAYKPRFATTPVLLVLGLSASVAVAAYLAYRPRRRSRTGLDASWALTLADVLADTLDDLRAEPDPRRAVIAAYARLEHTLGAFGLPRRAAEGPDEYVQRIFVDLGVSSRFARRLTQLFARAKFSQHAVEQTMKDEAIDLLEAIRTALGEADDRGRDPGASAPSLTTT